ncbi:hypothetical protein ASC90_05425 [Rhizobium sp. Root1220]|nr:hypothetical protein ASC90_05425 [Rhizobium sp. Root1220]
MTTTVGHSITAGTIGMTATTRVATTIVTLIVTTIATAAVTIVDIAGTTIAALDIAGTMTGFGTQLPRLHWAPLLVDLSTDRQSSSTS